MIGEISGLRNLHRGKVWSANSLVGEVPVGVSIGEVSVGSLSSEKCQSGNCLVKEQSYNR